MIVKSRLGLPSSVSSTERPSARAGDIEGATTVNGRDARKIFWGKDKLNCAQAILTAFRPTGRVREDDVARSAALGKGKAPGGECGALYAARMLVSGEEAEQELERRFVAATGSTACRRIRKLRQASCHECVEAAGNALSELVPSPPPTAGS